MKLLVMKAVATTFAFAAQHWLDALRIIWAPMALCLASAYLLQPVFLEFSVRMADGISPGAFFIEMLPWYLLMLTLTTVFGLIMSAGILKLVLRGEKPRLPFYLGFGMDEVRLFITGLVFVCIFFMLQVSIMVLTSINTAFTNIAPALGGITAFILGMILLWVLIRLILRLSLTAAASIDTRRVGVKPGASGTRGNEMRLMGYWLMWLVIGLTVQVVETAILSPETLRAYLGMLNPNSIESRLGINEAVIAAARDFDLSTPMGLARSIVSWMLATLQTVIGLIAAGVAWRMITEGRNKTAHAPEGAVTAS